MDVIGDRWDMEIYVKASCAASCANGGLKVEKRSMASDKALMITPFIFVIMIILCHKNQQI